MVQDRVDDLEQLGVGRWSSWSLAGTPLRNQAEDRLVERLHRRGHGPPQLRQRPSAGGAVVRVEPHWRQAPRQSARWPPRTAHPQSHGAAPRPGRAGPLPAGRPGAARCGASSPGPFAQLQLHLLEPGVEGVGPPALVGVLGKVDQAARARADGLGDARRGALPVHVVDQCDQERLDPLHVLRQQPLRPPTAGGDAAAAPLPRPPPSGTLQVVRKAERLTATNGYRTETTVCGRGLAARGMHPRPSVST
jgi:hypothetical protein